jgi:hypothetical protein
MKFLFSIFSIAVLMISCNGKSKEISAKEETNYQKSKETLEQTEQKNPTKFLMAMGDKKKNLLGQTVVKGSIMNHAKMVSFKDVDVKISFYSKTGALLEEDHETIYETIEPGSTVKFKTKLFSAKGTDSVGFKIEGAKF